MDEYLKYVSTFHKDLVTSLSQKEKYIRCADCENKKQFIVNDNKLIYNCGTDSGQCGHQFIITIPDYIHYEKMIQAFKQSIHGSFTYHEDIHDYSEYNLDELSKYLPLDEELKEYHELKQTILKDSQILTSLFVSSNQLKQYYDSLTNLNTDIQKNNIRKKKILHELHNDQILTIEDKISLRKEYATIVSREKHELYPVYESILNHENNHYLLLEPKDTYVEKINTRYLEKGTKKKEKKEKKEKKPDEKEYVFDKDHKGYQMCKNLSENKLSDSKIKANRKEIYDEIMKHVGNEEITVDNFTDLLTDKEMKLLFELYDQTFFKNKLSELSRDLGCQWVICWNNRCSTTAGRQSCKMDGGCKMIKIELSSTVFRNVLKNMEQQDDDFISMDGKNNCDSILSCLQLTFEHELVHALQDCFCTDWMKSKKGPGLWEGKKSPGSSHSKTFMSILNNTFGQIDYKHQLFKSGDKKRKDEPKGKKSTDEEASSALIDAIVDHFKINHGVMTEIEYDEIRGDYKTKWGGRLFSSLRYIPGDKITNPWKKTEQEKYGPMIEKVGKSPTEIRLTEEWMEYLDIEEKEKKPKGLGDQLEELQVDIMKGVSKAEEEKKKSRS